MARRASGLAPKNIGVKTVKTKNLRANPHNPRVLFDRQPLDVLKASIKKVGILVPLTVFRRSRQSKYTILDGQRRWMCAQELRLTTVPVNQVAEPTLVQNIVTMFQIHKLREDWELMPTALKLEVLMKKLDERSDRRLAELTGLDPAVVTRCKKLLSYPTKYQDMMLDPDPEERVKADFFIELYAVRNDRVVNQMDWYSRPKFTDRMLAKYEKPDSGLKAVTDFRKIKQHVGNAKKVGKTRSISKRLREFTYDDSLPIEHLAVPQACISADARAILRTAASLEKSIAGLDVERFYGEKDLWDALERLVEQIRAKLRDADRRV